MRVTTEEGNRGKYKRVYAILEFIGENLVMVKL